MQAAMALVATVIASMTLLASSADAGRVRVSQEMTQGKQDFVIHGFVKTFDPSDDPSDPLRMRVAEIYKYHEFEPCQTSYNGTTFLPALDATVMAVVDMSEESQVLFTVHDFPCPEPPDPNDMGGRADMLFMLEYDDDDSMECLLKDDPDDPRDEIDCEVATATMHNEWNPGLTDGFALGPLDGLWRLDASITASTSQVIVRSSSEGGGDVGGLMTDRTIRLDNVIEVDVDVQPGPDVGCLRIDGNGVVPVAILGDADFDVGEVDVSTLAFAGMLVRVRGNGKHQCGIEDVNHDAHPDLACHFYDDPEAWTPGDTTAAVSGELVDSTPIYGEDLICVRAST